MTAVVPSRRDCGPSCLHIDAAYRRLWSSSSLSLLFWKDPSNTMETSDSAHTGEWPNERIKILVPAWTLMIISTAFLVWRVVYGFMHGRKFMICDYLLIIATVGSVPTFRSTGRSNKVAYSFSTSSRLLSTKSLLMPAWEGTFSTHRSMLCATLTISG